MAKKVDITEKLSYNEPPCLVIRGKELKVNDDAATVLKTMGLLSEGTGAKQIVEMYELFFDEETRTEIEAMKLNFKDFRIVVEAAIGLIVGDDEEAAGEEVTHTTI